MTTQKTTLKDLIDLVENDPHIRQLAPELRKLIRDRLQSLATIEFPTITLKEDDWIVAHTPLIDVSAQGKTEEEAIENLKAMIEDYMTDPDTPKPKIEKILQMQIGLKTIRMTVPLIMGVPHGGKNTSPAP